MKNEEKEANTQVEEIKIKQTKGNDKYPSEPYYSIKTPVGTYNVKATLLPTIPKIGDQFNVRYTEAKYQYEGKEVTSKWVVSVGDGVSASNAPTSTGKITATDFTGEFFKDAYAAYTVGIKCFINQEDILFPEFLTRVKVARGMIDKK